ncbi:glycogen/starch synthase [Bacteroidota bacterium]
MEGPVRILFASSEVTPFASRSPMSDLIRNVPEYLHEHGGFESRIMMPRYGTISERRNRLHEVIRLSGSNIALGHDEETLKVKVASIPGIRLQVYFMDSARYFKRKGIYEDRDKTLFPDNLTRAVLFARSVLTTATNLGWSPDVIHAHGWISALIPVILRSEFAESRLFSESRVFYSADGFEVEDSFSEEQAELFGLPNDPRLIGKPLTDVGPAFSDLLITGEGSPALPGETVDLTGSVEDITALAASHYGQFSDTTVQA